jgi:hypothetical protein
VLEDDRYAHLLEVFTLILMWRIAANDIEGIGLSTSEDNSLFRHSKLISRTFKKLLFHRFKSYFDAELL